MRRLLTLLVLLQASCAVAQVTEEPIGEAGFLIPDTVDSGDSEACGHGRVLGVSGGDRNPE